MMKKLILIGGGGHCKACIDVIEQENKYEIHGILDINEKIGQKILSYTFIGCDEDLESLVKENYYFLITIGQIKSPEKRILHYEKLLSLNAKIATIISPLAYVSKYAEIGSGTIVMHQAIINAGAKVGKNCIINSKALIEHDSIIESHCHISTNAVINGNCLIQKKSFVGSAAICVQGSVIKENSYIKANDLVYTQINNT